MSERIWYALRQTAYVCALALGFGIGFAMCSGCGFAPAAFDPADDAATDAHPLTDGHALDGDAIALGDAASIPGDGPTILALTETGNDTVTPGTSVVCYAPGAMSTLDGVWYRVFPLAQMGVTGAFHVTSVWFGVSAAQNAAGVTVSIGTYSGTVGAQTLSTGSISIAQSINANVPDASSPELVRATLPTTTMPAGSNVVVEVVAPSMQNVGSFHLGATTAGESLPGYFSSAGCSFSPPKSTTMLGGSGHLVIDLGGYQ